MMLIRRLDTGFAVLCSVLALGACESQRSRKSDDAGERVLDSGLPDASGDGADADVGPPVSLPRIEFAFDPCGVSQGVAFAATIEPRKDTGEPIFSASVFRGYREDCSKDCVISDNVGPRPLTRAESLRVKERLEAIPEGDCEVLANLACDTFCGGGSLTIAGKENLFVGCPYDNCEGYLASLGRLMNLLSQLSSSEPPEPDRPDCFSPLENLSNAEEPDAQGCGCDGYQRVCTEGLRLTCKLIPNTPYARWNFDNTCSLRESCPDGDFFATKPNLEECLEVAGYCDELSSGKYCAVTSTRE